MFFHISILLGCTSVALVFLVNQEQVVLLALLVISVLTAFVGLSVGLLVVVLADLFTSAGSLIVVVLVVRDRTGIFPVRTCLVATPSSHRPTLTSLHI